MMILLLIVIIFFNFLMMLGISYFENGKRLDETSWCESYLCGILCGLLMFFSIEIVSYKDISAKLLSQNKNSAQFEVDSSIFWGLVYNTRIEIIEKFTNNKLKYNDRYFVIMKLAGKDISKYADVVNDTVIYRMTPLQEMEGK